MAPRAAAITPLTIRASSSLISDKVGVLSVHTSVVVLRVVIHKSGTVRAEIANASDAQKRPMGWVTSFKGGVEMLRMQSAAQLNGGFFTSGKGFYNRSRIAQ